MNLLVDTNIFLEVLLEQARSQDSQEFLAKTDAHNFFISDFSLHSIGVLLLKRKEPDVFRKFVSDVLTRAGTAARDSMLMKWKRWQSTRGSLDSTLMTLISTH